MPFFTGLNEAERYAKSRPYFHPLAISRAKEVMGEEVYENEVSFTPEALVNYLMTQTNVMAALEKGRESLGSANQWLLEQVRPYFTNSSAAFIFRTRAWYLQKAAVPSSP